MRTTLLRAFVALALLANLFYLAWSQGWLAFAGLSPDGQRDPTRREQEVRPGAMRVLSPQAAAAAAAAAVPPAAPASGAVVGPPAPLPATPSATPASAPASTPASGTVADAAGGALACVEVGPLDTQGALDGAQRALDAVLPGRTWTRDRRPGAAQYAVFVGPILSREAARSRREELVKLKISFEAIELPPGREGRQGGYSLGLHDSRDAAERSLSALRERGLKNASIVLAREAGAPRTWLRAEGLSPLEADSVRALPPSEIAAGATVSDCLMGSAMSVGVPAR